MRTRLPTSRRPGKSADPSIDSDLPEQAKRLKQNLPQVPEAGLSESIRQHEREQWLEKNRAALDAYDEHIEKHGVFSDGLRSF